MHIYVAAAAVETIYMISAGNNKRNKQEKLQKIYNFLTFFFFFFFFNSVERTGNSDEFTGKGRKRVPKKGKK